MSVKPFFSFFLVVINGNFCQPQVEKSQLPIAFSLSS